MRQIGKPPYIECSSRGDKRFSAFYAKVRGRSIEAHYQAAKVFDAGKAGNVTGLTWKEAKGQAPINIKEVRRLYKELWREYLMDNPSFITILKKATGLSDIYGQDGHVCQAVTLWQLREEL